MGIRETARALGFENHTLLRNKLSDGQKKRKGIVENTLLGAHATRILIDLLDRPITYDMIKNADPHLRLTKGTYGLVYYGYGDNYTRMKNKTPFVLQNDLVNCKVKLSGPEMLHALAKEMPEFEWMMRNTNYHDDLFEVAKSARCISIPFSFNVYNYVQMLKNKGDKNKNPFINRMLNSHMAHVYKGDKVHPAKTRNEFMCLMTKVEQSEVVQNEMEHANDGKEDL